MWLKDDWKRYHWLVGLHTTCTVAFVIRFILLCTDLSAANNDAIAFPVIILILELGSSFIILMANFLYIFLRYLGPILFESDHQKVGCCSQSFAWNLSTLTCFRSECYQDHPELVSITRFCVLILFEIMRFVAFILACVCANRYGPIGLGYSIVAAFSLIPAIGLLVVEYLHYYRLWHHYRPDTSAEERPVYSDKHYGFIPLSMTNDQQTSHWQNSRCDKGQNCPSRSPFHVMMYHSGNTRYSPEQVKENPLVVGFHQTSHRAAYSIAQEGFRESATGMLGPGVYFAIALDHTEFKANHFGTYICTQVYLGKTKHTNARWDSHSEGGYDTIYYEHPNGADEFCVRSKQQIRSWVIVVDQDPNVQFLEDRHNEPLRPGVYVEDQLEASVYQGCWIV